MKKALIIFAALTITFSAFSQDKKALNIDNSNIALEGYSPVSYLDLGLAQIGSKECKSEHNKAVYYFTSIEQKEKFDNSPDRYLPQYGGFCAYGIYAGAKFRVDPDKFLVEDEKYYLFLENVELDALQLWQQEKNHKALVAKANENWRNLQSTYN